MTIARRRFLHLAAGLAAVPAFPHLASAQAYPSRPVRVIVPFAPGGPTDVFARLVAIKMSELTGKQFYVENVGGAGGSTGSGRAAQAAPDGYTMLQTGGGHVNNPFLYNHVPYDPFRDFDAVTLGASQGVVLATHPSVPAHSVKELVALIKNNPGKYSFASPGVGPPPLKGTCTRSGACESLNNSPTSCGGVPTPGEAKLYLPGLFLISATSSLTLCADTDGCTASTTGWLAPSVTASKSRNGS